MKFLILSFFIMIFYLISCSQNGELYMCEPCDLPCDNIVFDKPGTCPHCNMKLIKKSELEKENDWVLNQINIENGSGFFVIDGGKGHKEDYIKIHYHLPNSFHTDSEVLIVIPGAGRNSDSYRDAWVEESEKYGVLILSPMYSSDSYGFEDYHLGGLIETSNLEASIMEIENTNHVYLEENDFKFETNPDSEEWIFNDFDRIFELAAKELKLASPTYDIFGHSAGGHILHRMAIFKNDSKANKIFAANPSFYTVPDAAWDFPFGLKRIPIETVNLERAFKSKLVITLGEMDNENETGGTFLRSLTADKQGLHRLERGKFFYERSKAIAEKKGLEFNWHLEIVTGVGHNHEQIGHSVGKILYSKNGNH